MSCQISTFTRKQSKDHHGERPVLSDIATEVARIENGENFPFFFFYSVERNPGSLKVGCSGKRLNPYLCTHTYHRHV